MLDDIILRNVDRGDLDYWTIGRVMMTCLGSRTFVVLYERLIDKLESKTMWKLFVGKPRDVGFREDLVLPEFFLALKDAFRADRMVLGYISPDSFVRLFDRLLFVASWLFQEYGRDDTLKCGKLSTDDCSYYHKVLALKLVTMLVLILLEESNYSQVLLALLTGSDNITDLLPQKFVSSLLNRRNGRSLNLDPEVVAGAFMSVKDHLVIVCRGDLSPKIHAPCAIFVDLNKFKEEIMRVLFPRKNTLSVNTSTHNVVVGTILELPSHVSVNRKVNPVTECKGELQMKQKVLKEISEFITKNKGILPCIYSMESVMTTDLDQKICALATALEEEKLCTREDMTLALGEFSKLRVLLELSLQETEHSGFMKNLDGILEWLNTSRPMVDDFLKHYGRNLRLGKW
nr:UvrD-like helicase, ATP-binding domain, P-loop containing nucleoside triphosphate hydrolase [Tanacetum cinerariifolium]